MKILQPDPLKDVSSIRELIENKFLKLNYISYSESSLQSKEDIEVSFTLNKNIGVNKDTDKLLISVKYKDAPIYTTATLEKDAQEYMLTWFFATIEDINKSEDEKLNSNIKLGKKLFKEL